VHFDFKDNQAPLLHAVWDVLGEYQDWITTATKGKDPHELTACEPKPLLVLTEDSDAQEEVFFNQVPMGSKPFIWLRTYQLADREERTRVDSPGSDIDAGTTSYGAADQLSAVVE
jgi:hypothetical protein